MNSTKFDKVVKKCKDGEYRPVFSDLKECVQDCIDLDRCLKKYQVEDENDIYRLNDPTMKELTKTLTDIALRIKRNKNENYLVILLFAGHGILKQGV